MQIKPTVKFDGTNHDLNFSCTHSNPKAKNKAMGENILSGKEERKS